MMAGMLAAPWRRVVTASRRLPTAADWRFTALVAVVYGAVALLVGIHGGLFQLHWLQVSWWLYVLLPCAMVLVPCLLEEAFFRAMLISVHTPNRSQCAAQVILSLSLYVLWHPLNAWLFLPTLWPLFSHPAFILIVMLLGVSCSLVYLRSGSLWPPVFLHWCSVLGWVFGLGGHHTQLQWLG